MTNNEKELLTLIRENENPERALITAVLIIGRALELSGSSPIPSADSQQEHA
jgi:hypothetical protein